MRGAPLAPVALLIVEDDTVTAMTLEDELSVAGYRIVGSFVSCSAALTWLETAKPDAAVLDIRLSDGPCTELALELNRRRVPFVVYTGNVKALNTIKVLDAATWIAKPSPISAIRLALQDLLHPKTFL